MSRYRGPKVKVLRKFVGIQSEGNSNNRAATTEHILPGFSKKTIGKLSGPGQHGAQLMRKKYSDYGRRLLEKQKLRYNYGLTEGQLVEYVKVALRSEAATGFMLLQQLEMRLDTIVFSLGLARTIIAARQFVTHGHLYVNGKPVNIPSYQCVPGDKITLKTEKAKRIVRELDEGQRVPQTHLSWDAQTQTGTVNNFVSRSSVQLNIDELLVVAFYSRKL